MRCDVDQTEQPSLESSDSATSAATGGRSTSSASRKTAAADERENARPAETSDVHEPDEPPASQFELLGWKCEELSGFGNGCLGYPVARAVSLGGTVVCFTSDTEDPFVLPQKVFDWLRLGVKP